MSKGRKSRVDLKSDMTSKSSSESNSPRNNPSTTNQITSSASARSQSEFPTPTEAAMANLSLQSTESQTEKNVRSQTECPKKRRYGVSSVVPDSAVLTPIRRPDAQGTVGNDIEIYTNHFPVSIDDAIINQYDIDIAMVRDGRRPCPAKKNERWEVLQILSRHEKNFPIVWYDEGKNLYTRELLTDFTRPRRVKLTINNQEKTFEFKVLNLVRQEKIGNIFDFIHGKTTIRPRDPIRIIETLFKQSVHNQYICIRNKYYDRRQKMLDLGDGRGLASGFHQALCLTRDGPTINVNLAFTCFYQPLNFVDFACQYLRQDITRGVNEAELEGMQKLFKNILIKTTHAGRPIQYRLKLFGLPANRLTFDLRCKDDSGSASLPKQITVAEYFAKNYKALKYPNLPCIDARNGEEERAQWLPMETVQIVEWERAMRPLDSVQQALVGKKAIIKPDKRYDQIMDIINKRNFNSDSYLKALNIQVNTKDMLKIHARILPPPQIKYRTQNNQEVVEHVSFGKWKIGNQFRSTSIINKWGMIYFGPQPNEDIIEILKKFEQQLPLLLRRYGIGINSNPLTMAKPSRKDEIDKTFSNIKSQGWQLAIVILNDTIPAVYDYVKHLGNQKFGLITQCASFQAIERNSEKLHMYVENLSQKLNAKIGGINGIINLKTALSQASHNDRFMFFGADVTHTTSSKEKPSIAAIVGSCDPTCSRYAARLCEQYPKKNRCSIEIIKDMDKMVIDLLRVYARSCGNTLPNRIIFYRDGVDDGQFQKVLDNEVNKIKSACRVVYGQHPLPRLTFIIVKKRHNTRFFTYNGQKTDNVEAGTVVDLHITHPSQFDFYLCSQTAIMGTSRPALYHVLHDENGFSSDDIQQLTYWLCHTDVRCSKSVSIPAPVHYAHLAAYASNAYEFDHSEDENLENEDDEKPSEEISLEDIQTKVMILNNDIQDTMWFV
ncbi:unnamed protein product [Rotaria sordida]|uniref:Uncharacterized protein n=1 Tax=Rotaria sordida TaxID=392033 RepID=A0A815VU16_9BILA|nr:unnamed protein product [Rotaria sordida]CAF1534817.1 unnamed protein product [Rotaria sordida]